MSNVPVIQAVRAAEAFRRLHWRRVAGVLAAAALGSTLSQGGQLAQADGLRALGEITYVVAAVMAYAALMRLAFIDEHPDDPEFTPGPHGFQWRKPEWRLIGLGLLMLFLLLLALALFVFILMIILASAGIAGALTPETTPQSVMEALSPGARLAMFVVVVGFFGVVALMSVRLGLAPAATIARRELVLFQTWPLTKGQFWRIFAATFLVGLPSIAAGIVTALLLGLMGYAPDGEHAPVALPAALAVGAVTGLVAGFITLPLSAGLTAYLYRGLRPSEEVPPVA